MYESVVKLPCDKVTVAKLLATDKQPVSDLTTLYWYRVFTEITNFLEQGTAQQFFFFRCEVSEK